MKHFQASNGNGLFILQILRLKILWMSIVNCAAEFN